VLTTIPNSFIAAFYECDCNPPFGMNAILAFCNFLSDATSILSGKYLRQLIAVMPWQ